MDIQKKKRERHFVSLFLDLADKGDASAVDFAIDLKADWGEIGRQEWTVYREIMDIASALLGRQRIGCGLA